MIGLNVFHLMALSVMFDSTHEACTFILGWDGKSAHELLAAMGYARQYGDRSQQNCVCHRVSRMTFEFPRPKDIPIYIGSPVWVVDQDGNALIGMPGLERIEHVDELRRKIPRHAIDARLFRNDTTLI